MLEQIIEEMQKRGFERQAVLLGSKKSQTYLRVLLQERWRQHVAAQLGESLYEELETYQKKTTDFYNLLVNEALRDLSPDFPPDLDFTLPSLRIERKNFFNEAALENAKTNYRKICELVEQATLLVNTTAKEIIGADDEMIFRVYKDMIMSFYHGERKITSEVLERRINYSVEKLGDYEDDKFGIDSLPLCRNYPAFINYIMLCNSLPNYKGDNHQKYFSDNPEEVSERIEELGEEGFRQEVRELITYAKATTTNRKQLMREYDSFISVQTTEASIRKRAKKEFEQNVVYNGEWCDIDAMDDLTLSASIETRKESIEYIEDQIKHRTDQIVGLLQIGSGGAVTNPNADPISALQNHEYYPNLLYNEEVRKQVRKLAQEAKKFIDDFPDIHDAILPSRLRKHTPFFYTMQELPKDPLDVTIGNDGSACIFVPKESSELKNGIFIPVYLLHPGVHFFANYRLLKEDETGRQRMGFILAFDTYRQESPKQRILACNSLEFSRIGILGGRETLRELTEYDEAWITQYAQTHGYAGATMGTHDYNTSVNYSSKIGTVVQEQLRMNLGVIEPFYSDIFQFDRKKMQMVTRSNSSYWIWKNNRKVRNKK